MIALNYEKPDEKEEYLEEEDGQLDEPFDPDGNRPTSEELNMRGCMGNKRNINYRYQAKWTLC